jgi:polyhydroxyalkanoate synthesis regulator phasin
MARRPGKPSDVPEALREAVERTVEATLGSAGRGREAAQGALDDLAGTVEELRRGAEDRLSRSRRSVAEAIEGRRLATHEDIGELKAELRAIGRRLDAIEARLPAKRTRSGAKSTGGGSGTRPSTSSKRRT